jgi:hypothetical protein
MPKKISKKHKDLWIITDISCLVFLEERGIQCHLPSGPEDTDQSVIQQDYAYRHTANAVPNVLYEQIDP